MTDKTLEDKVKAAEKLRTSIQKLPAGSYVRNELERRLVDLTMQIHAERDRRAEEDKTREMLQRLSRDDPFR